MIIYITGRTHNIQFMSFAATEARKKSSIELMVKLQMLIPTWDPLRVKHGGLKMFMLGKAR